MSEWTQNTMVLLAFGTMFIFSLTMLALVILDVIYNLEMRRRR